MLNFEFDRTAEEKYYFLSDLTFVGNNNYVHVLRSNVYVTVITYLFGPS